MKYFAATLAIWFFSWPAFAQPDAPAFYRGLAERLRPEAEFRVPMPSGGDLQFSYKLKIGDPIYQLPKISDFITNPAQSKYFDRKVWDRLWLKDGSTAFIGGEEVPLTCVFMSLQDNRYSGPRLPIVPELIISFYIVANDYTCQGPIKPGWPQTGGDKENWSTYIHYEVRDPTIMLPTDIKLRYRKSSFPALLVR